MRRRLAPILFEEDDCEDAGAQRSSPVAKAEVSPGAKLKASTKRTADGLPVHSFATLLVDLSTLALNTVKVAGKKRDVTCEASAKPTAAQKRGAGAVRRRCECGGAPRTGYADKNPSSIRRRIGKTAAFPKPCGNPWPSTPLNFRLRAITSNAEGSVGTHPECRSASRRRHRSARAIRQGRLIP